MVPSFLSSRARRDVAPVESSCQGTLEIVPTSNAAMGSAAEREDAADAFARVLMGLSYPLQIVSQAREIERPPEWRKAPRLRRRWLAVLRGKDAAERDWRIRTLSESFEGIGLHARVVDCLDGACHARRVRPSSVFVDGDANPYHGTLVLRRWPREVTTGWLGNATAGELPIDWAIHVHPEDAKQVARYLKRQQSWQSDQYSAKPDAHNALGRRDAQETQRKLIAGTDRPVKVAVAFTVAAPSEAELKVRMDTMRHQIGLTLSDARPSRWEMDRGYEATSPEGACNLLGAWRRLDCTSVASAWPFMPATVWHEHGAPLGTTNRGSMEVRLDPFDESLESFGGVILAKVGAGKSYLLKLLTMRMPDTEILIVEQRNPPEYQGVHATTVNLADLDYGERAGRLREFVENIWATAKRDPRPRLLVLDELWSLLLDAQLARLVEEIARIGRHHYLSMWIATQQVSEMLGCREGKAVLDNAAIRIYLKQHDRDLAAISEAVGLSKTARRFIRSAARGQALLSVNDLLVPVDIQATKREHELISTDPRERFHATATEDPLDDSKDHLPDSLQGVGGLWLPRRRTHHPAGLGTSAG